MQITAWAKAEPTRHRFWVLNTSPHRQQGMRWQRVVLTSLVGVLFSAAAVGQEVPAVLTVPEPAEQVRAPVQIAAEEADPGYAVADVRAASFQEVTPGKTTLEQLRESMGEPDSEQTAAGMLTLTYQIGPFPRVEMIVVEEKVASVVIHLSEPANPEAVAAELNVAKFVPSPIVDDQRKLLGRVYPERALVFNYAPETTPPKVTQIILEPVSAEPFMLRVESDRGHHFRRQVADLRFVRKLDPNNARAHWLEAEILARMGKTEDATDLIESACRLEPDNLDFRLSRAEHLVRRGRLKEGGEVATAIAESDDVIGRRAARADLILGDVVLGGSSPDYKASMDHYMATIDLAAQLTSDPQMAVRVEGKRLLIDAYLAVAVNIARGNWNRKDEMVPRWLSNAEAVIDDMINNEGSDPSLRLLLHRRTLESHAAMRGAIDPTVTADAALTLGRRLIADADDPDYQQVLEWELATAIGSAAQALHARGKASEAGRLARMAISLFESGADSRTQDSVGNYDLGITLFLIGAVEAVSIQDHQEAVAWFDKAAELLEGPVPAGRSFEMGGHGERLVSMGVSYWNVGQKDKALNLTQRGSELMELAAANGQLAESALSVPYGNLSSMHGELGNSAEAQRMAEKAAAVGIRR